MMNLKSHVAYVGTIEAIEIDIDIKQAGQFIIHLKSIDDMLNMSTSTGILSQPYFCPE